MIEEELSEQRELLPLTVGEKLRAAREAKGLSLEQLSAESRITVRHLTLIEANDFAALPGRTYAVGFSRTYARLLGLDGDAIAREVRAELSAMVPHESRLSTFEPGDPARVPSRMLAWVSAAAAIVLFGGLLFFVWTSFVSPSGDLPWLTEDQPAATPASAPMAALVTPTAMATGGPVVFTSLEDGVWVKFYDAAGRQLLQKAMAKGETYILPGDVEGPQLWTGRPDALAITVGGKPVARLAESQKIVKDVPVSAEALLARAAMPSTGAPAPATGAAAPAASPGASSASTPSAGASPTA
ncbi:helix-turn-helix domain-containing protein [Altererythrobacter sp. CC-YST694]|uniref:helix-turn-helix domain-containing protein n=1 Tax=Altererythrobacter sp. CC-YST694 TaxID=2755038 RepID=UPI001D010A54|nr:RodZ domain-containing protein [Altererythrobacter sp. CC-YST694]MCB5426139.1 helix-turn-helix domain-containing protein [Altererythrobacter sp. CC-YST694]